MCTRLNIQCLGVREYRYPWMRDEMRLKAMTDEIKNWTSKRSNYEPSPHRPPMLLLEHHMQGDSQGVASDAGPGQSIPDDYPYDDDDESDEFEHPVEFQQMTGAAAPYVPSHGTASMPYNLAQQGYPPQSQSYHNSVPVQPYPYHVVPQATSQLTQPPYNALGFNQVPNPGPYPNTVYYPYSTHPPEQPPQAESEQGSTQYQQGPSS